MIIAVFLAVTAYYFYGEYREIIKGRLTAEGSVIDVKKSSPDKTAGFRDVIISVRFRAADGADYIVQSAESGETVKTGDKAEVVYKPDNPAGASVAPVSQYSLLPFISGFLAVAFALLAVFFLVLSRRFIAPGIKL